MLLIDFSEPEYKFMGEIRSETVAEPLLKIYLHRNSGHTFQICESRMQFRKTLTIDVGSGFHEWENLEG